jgi:hypothetical protein
MHTIAVNLIDLVLSFFLRPPEQLVVWVDFELISLGDKSLDELKCELVELVKRKKWFIKSHENFGTPEEKFSSFSTYEDLIGYVAGY